MPLKAWICDCVNKETLIVKGPNMDEEKALVECRYHMRVYGPNHVTGVRPVGS